jgi:hypothetical protein
MHVHLLQVHWFYMGFPFLWLWEYFMHVLVSYLLLVNLHLQLLAIFLFSDLATEELQL